MAEQGALHLKLGGEHGKDVFLCHTGTDKPWVEKLAERIEAEPYQTRFLGAVFDKWDFEKGGNIVVDIEREIDACRFVGVVVTRAMLAAAWPTMERSIAVWSDPSGSKGRVIPLLRENVTLPASLRIRNWIDFRDDARFEEGLAELVRVLRGEKTPRGRGSLLPTIPETKLPYDPAPVVITSSVGADRIEERLLSNLLPVVELPQTVFSAGTPLRSKSISANTLTRFLIRPLCCAKAGSGHLSICARTQTHSELPYSRQRSGRIALSLGSPTPITRAGRWSY